MLPIEPPLSESSHSSSSHELMVFLFSDLVDSTGWKQTLGDVAYAESVLRPHNS